MSSTTSMETLSTLPDGRYPAPNNKHHLNPHGLLPGGPDGAKSLEYERARATFPVENVRVLQWCDFLHSSHMVWWKAMTRNVWHHRLRSPSWLELFTPMKRWPCTNAFSRLWPTTLNSTRRIYITGIMKSITSTRWEWWRTWLKSQGTLFISTIPTSASSLIPPG